MITIAEIRAKVLDQRVNDVKQFHVKRRRPLLMGWSDQDFEMLKELRVEGRLSIDEVAQRLGRTGSAVRKKLHELGWVAPYHRSKPVDWSVLDPDLIRLHGEGFWVDDIAKTLRLTWRQVQTRGYRLGLSWRGQGARYE